MNNTTEYIEEVTIDICSKTFCLRSDMGSHRTVSCETSEEFMNVLEVCTESLNPDQIKYDSIAVSRSV